jgi:hypothetical protein
VRALGRRGLERISPDAEPLSSPTSAHGAQNIGLDADADARTQPAMPPLVDAEWKQWVAGPCFEADDPLPVEFRGGREVGQHNVRHERTSCAGRSTSRSVARLRSSTPSRLCTANTTSAVRVLNGIG